MTNYKNLDVSACLKIGKPRKVNGVHQSNTSFKVQTPEVIVDLDNKSINFRMIKKGKFVTLLEELENKIVSVIYNNSTDFFNGKTFTLNKIRDSLEKLFTLDNEGVVTLNNVTIPSNVKVYDHFNELLPENKSLGMVKGVCILELDNVKFVKSVIKIGFTMTHLKLSVEKKKFTECILDDEPNVQDSESSKTCIKDLEKSDTVVDKEQELANKVEVENINSEKVEVENINSEQEYTDFFEE